MNVKSDLFKFFSSVIIVALLLFPNLITNHVIETILIVCIIFAFFYDIYKTTIKKGYKLKWVIVIIDIVYITFGVVAVYFCLSYSSEEMSRIIIGSGYNIQLVMFCILLLNLVFTLIRSKSNH